MDRPRSIYGKRHRHSRGGGTTVPALNEFQAALIAAAIEDAAGKPCALCGAPAAGADVWAPSGSAARSMGAPPGKIRIIVSALCAACVALPDATRRLEEAALADAKNRRRLLDSGWEIDGNIGYLPGRPTPDWVREIIESGACDSPYVFAWRESPRVVYVRTSDGTIYALADEGVDAESIPPPPEFLRGRDSPAPLRA